MANTDPQGNYQEEKDLLEQARLIFIQIKNNYAEFLSSLKYENLSDKKRTKQIRRKEEEASDYDHWVGYIAKNFSFQQEIISQNSGYASFIKLIDNIKKLEQINHQMATCIFLEQRSPAGQQQLQNVVQMFEHMEKGIMSFLEPASSLLKKDKK